MNRADAIPYVSYVVDTALWGGTLAERQATACGVDLANPDVTLVGWQCGFEPLFVAVVDCLGGAPDMDEAEELATDYLTEIDWLQNSALPDHYIGKN